MNNQKLELIREGMLQKKIAAYIIPTSDPHKSEYISSYWKIREWITGFSGSAGTAVVTKKYAGLWTDFRYFNQAENQLNKPFILHKLKTRTPEYIDWLLEELDPNDNVGLDYRLFSAAEIELFQQKLNKKQISIVSVGDLADSIWSNRPPVSEKQSFLHPEKYCGLTAIHKIEKVRSYLSENKATYFLASALDEIAWLLNIRGSDVPFNPVITSYCIVNSDETIWFINPQQVPEKVNLELKNFKVRILPYQEIYNYLNGMKDGNVIVLDKNSTNYEIFSSISNGCRVINEPSILTKWKAIKTSKEINIYKEVQIQDGIAMCRFLHWVENEVRIRMVTELEAANKSAYFRKQQPGFVDLSFEPISAYQQNAALPHYSPDEKNQSVLEPKGIYLIDSGAQYFGGTTDITRTIALGHVTQDQITDFTLVLKGHIRLAMCQFPKGTCGIHLDAMARYDLWQHGKDYGHGTGHGIGYFLNVHEGPHGFSQATTGASMVPFEEGMLVTNEPGIYHQNKYGIRIENVMFCQRYKVESEAEFLNFETISYCPIDRKLIDKNLLDAKEIDWINQYHKNVRDLLKNNLNGNELVWLINNTLPI